MRETYFVLRIAYYVITIQPNLPGSFPEGESLSSYHCVKLVRLGFAAIAALLLAQALGREGGH